MKTYKAFVKDPYDNGNRFFIERDYETKKAFVEDLRGNGYQVTYVKEKELFDWCLDKASYANNEDEHFAVWQFTKIPESDDEYEVMMDKYIDRYWSRRAHRKARYLNNKEEINRKRRSKYSAKKHAENLMGLNK